MTVPEGPHVLGDAVTVVGPDFRYLYVSPALEEAFLRIEVGDSSHRMPVLPTDEVDLDATSGRGLVLVEALATRWGVHSDGLGKRVWAEVDLA